MCEFNCIDFNADKVKLYEEVRKIVASIHPSDFGAVDAIKPGKPVKEMTKVEYENYKSMYNDDLKEIKIGYKWIKEKIKSIRQDYSKAVTCGRRSGSGKIVLEYYDDLTWLWGGSPSTEPLPFGIDCQTINSEEVTELLSDEQNTQQGTHNDQVCNTNEDNTDEFTAVDGASNRSLTPSSINNEDGDVDSDSE